MSNALIGYSGFVGSALRRQRAFDFLYRTHNIDSIAGRSFDTVICAAAPAQKWLANQDPTADRQKIEALIGHLKTIECRKFILISTVDVFKDSRGVDEGSVVEEAGLHAYGLNRRALEIFVETHFIEPLIIRLPGLVGPGLRKNVIYDFLNDNNLSAIDSRAVFQFYPMINLSYDIEIALDAQLKLLHLTAEPVSVAHIARMGFGKPFDNELASVPPRYDMRTQYAGLFAGTGHYQYSVRETLQAVRAYAQTEPKKSECESGGQV